MQHINEFDQRCKDRREKLTLYQNPVQTLRLASIAALVLLRFCFRFCVSHPVFLYWVVPIAIVWLLLESIPGFYTETIDSFEYSVQFVVWWIGLGILSSIGLGSGLQSGVLFLFPHIIEVCLAAQTCKTLDFESNTNMWFQSTPNLFKCPELTYESTPVNFFGIWKKIYLACFLQATGAAIGEIPPYWMTRAARLAAIETEGANAASGIPEELESNSKWACVNKMKSWMIRLLKTQGFYGVLLMASYPNIAFDMCGICCGHFLMPFWTFFGATFAGKALVRNTYQSLIYVALCSERYFETGIRLLQYVAPDWLRVDDLIRELVQDARQGFHKSSTSSESKLSDFGGSKDSGGASASVSSQIGFKGVSEILMVAWQVFMWGGLLVFIISCVSHFAQYYQLTLDQEESASLKAKLVHGPSPALGINSNSNSVNNFQSVSSYSLSMSSSIAAAAAARSKSHSSNSLAKLLTSTYNPANDAPITASTSV